MTTSKYSLADFFFPETDDIMTPPAEFDRWMDENQWALSMYEPRMLGAVRPRMQIERGGLRVDVVNLSSYNYMGLATHPEVIRAGVQALQEYGTGACGSPLLSGMADLHRTLETRMADFLGREDCMLYNSGFAGGFGTLAGLLRKGDVAILDEKCHLCLIDGAKYSRCKVDFFRHNDPDTLSELLKSHDGRRRLVVVEGVYSMDGDTADLAALVPVAEEHGVPVMIDEAHSMLVFGKNGRGVVEHYDMEGRIALQFGTFSKSFANVGGFTAGDRRTLRYMRYYTNPYGFSCALPPSVVAATTKALEVATRDNSLRERVWENTRYFRAKALEIGLVIGESESQVFPIMVGGDRRKLYELAAEMNRKGLFLAPVDYPSVPEDGLRYRVAITAAHTRGDLDRALEILAGTVAPYVREIGLAHR